MMQNNIAQGLQCNAMQCNYSQKKSLLYQIDEEHNIQAQGRKSGIVLFFFCGTTNRRKVNVNKFYEPHYIPSQKQPKRIIHFQDMKPKYSLVTEENIFFNCNYC